MHSGAALIGRSLCGGAFMGLANLVPGISGGTMLLAVGLYPRFVRGVADVTAFRFRAPALLMLACIAAGAAAAVLGGARLIGGLLDRHPAAMAALFIGLALGGVPLLRRRLQPIDRTVVIAAAAAVAVMAALAALDPDRAVSRGAPDAGVYALRVTAGLAGGATMVLPGVSGAYLLLILGQYRPVVDAVTLAAAAGRAGDWAAAAGAVDVLAPVAAGVVLGVVGVSHLVTMLLARRRRATLGFLLGLLLGSVIGLWPFTSPIPPAVGDVVRGTVLDTPAAVAAVDPRDYRRAPVLPSAGQAARAALLIAAGFGLSSAVARLGGDAGDGPVTPPGPTPRPS